MAELLRKVLNNSPYDREAIAPELERLAAHAEITDANAMRMLSEDELIALLPGHGVTIAADEAYNDRVLDTAPQLWIIARDGVGMDSIDFAAVNARGIVVTRAPMVHEAGADLTMGHIINAVRRMRVGDRNVRTGRFADRRAVLGRDVYGATLGILGLGRMGSAVARRAAGFDMSILAHDPYLDAGAGGPAGVALVSFEELLARADIITIHVPLMPETTGLIDADAIAAMKDGAYLINMSRGRVVDEPALLDALRSGKLAAAGLDVFAEEPPTLDNPLFELENVFCTPHMGSDTVGTHQRVLQCVVDNILSMFAGRVPDHVVNPECLEHERFRSEAWLSLRESGS